MKPRLRFVGGIWYCGTPTPTNPRSLRLPMGLGYSPRSAFEDWMQMRGKR